MKFSIRTRLAFSFAWMFGILLVLFSGVIYFFMSSNLQKELVSNLRHDSQQVIHEFDLLPWDAALIEMKEESDEFQLLIQVVDEHGQSVYLTSGVSRTEWPVDMALLMSARTQPVLSEIVIRGVRHAVWTQPLRPPGKGLYFLQTAKSKASMDHTRKELIRCINIGTPLLLIISIFVGRLFSRKALSPVEQIRERAENIRSDNLSERLVYEGPRDELFLLTETLNGLFGRIQRTLEQVRRFIADASHELRIPLAGLRGTLEVALRQKRTNEEYKRAIESAYSESERLSELVRELLALAKNDAGEMKLEKTQNDVRAFLSDVFAAAELLNVENNVRLQLGPVADGQAWFDQEKIHQLLLNLVENAIRYNKPGGDVLLSGAVNDGVFSVIVKDAGIGISPEDQPKIFDRFFRVDKARSREVGGTGLGLSIARAIAEAHGGTLSVASVEGVGSEFVLRLPAQSSDVNFRPNVS